MGDFLHNHPMLGLAGFVCCWVGVVAFAFIGWFRIAVYEEEKTQPTGKRPEWWRR